MTKLSQQDIKDLKETYPNINTELLGEDTARRPVVQEQPIKRSKYNAVPTVYQGVRYSSKKEARFAENLELRRELGEFAYVLRQVPFDLSAGIIYRADFVTLSKETVDYGVIRWDITVYEVKGMETPAWKLKHKLFKDKYPLIQLEVV